MSIRIPAGLRGAIYKRGKNSFRVQLSLGVKDGKPEIKRETVRGTEQDAMNLLIRRNVEYLDNTIQVTNYQTVRQAYDEWVKHVEKYRTPNTLRFYKQRFEFALLPELGHRRLKDITLGDLQKALAKYPNDQHNKRALSAFLNWSRDMGKLSQKFDFRKLETQSRPAPKKEEDVWSFEQVQKVYAALTFDNFYDIFIALGIECGLRPQEIMGLTWDRIHPDYLVIDQAVKERTPEGYKIGGTKTDEVRLVATTPYLSEKLTQHKANQKVRIIATAGYNRDVNLVVTDAMGNVPDLNYIRKYIRRLAKRAGVHCIPPKNLRSTYISLMGDLGIPIPVIQESVGHATPEMIAKHYLRVFSSSLQQAATLYHERLHGEAAQTN
ncbi:MAG: site-specific integrase [Clostridia bacterium]|nr:site-specific integrase [Clostridia bacterium]